MFNTLIHRRGSVKQVVKQYHTPQLAQTVRRKICCQTFFSVFTGKFNSHRLLLDHTDFLDNYAANRKNVPSRQMRFLMQTPQKSSDEILAESREMYVQGLSSRSVSFSLEILSEFYLFTVIKKRREILPGLATLYLVL